MKIKEFLQKYSLHDSTIISFHFDREKQEIAIDAELFLFMDQDAVRGTILFSGVQSYEVSIDNPDFDDNEIMGSRMILKGSKEVLELFCMSHFSKDNDQKFKTIYIDAEDVEWKP